jgi:DNA repair protein RecN (Recombination protein N)
MLLELRIGQLALVDEIVLPLGPGLTVLTGETGAGTSLIAGAMSLLCGGKAEKDWVRLGEETAYVEGVFDLSDAGEMRVALAQAGIRIGSDGILVLRRELRRQGRSRVLINGLVSSLTLLERVGPLLLSVQSQDQQRELDDPEFARRFLDEQLGCADLLHDMRDRWQEYRDRRDALAERRHEEFLATEQLDIWKYQFDELHQADLCLGEEEELAESLALLRHASALQEGAARAWQLLSEGQAPVRERLGECIASLLPLADKSRKLTDILQGLQAAQESVTDAAAELNRFLDVLDLDPAGLEEMEARKALFEELRRKYQRDTVGLLNLHDDLRIRIARQESAAGDLLSLVDEVATAQKKLERSALRLHEQRIAGAAAVGAVVLAKIRPLALPDLALEFRISPLEDPEGPVGVDGTPCRVTRHGCDRVELYVRTNPGESMDRVGRIASGGERSRIHLGLTAARRGENTASLLLLDEIDAGLGMDSAAPVAVLLHELAARGQVLCITHLATMAVHGAAHLKVVKEARSGRTLLRVSRLQGGERVDEVARLLGGESSMAGDWDSQFAYAVELLKTGKMANFAEDGC